MSRPLRDYLRAKAMLLAVICDEKWHANNHVVEIAWQEFVNAHDEVRG